MILEIIQFAKKKRFYQILITTHQAKEKRCFLSITGETGLAPEDGTRAFFEATCDCSIVLRDGYIKGEPPLTTIPADGMSRPK